MRARTAGAKIMVMFDLCDEEINERNGRIFIFFVRGGVDQTA